ncbi:MAG: phospholipase D-like domain-containing protein [Chloroflexi bacterium]|nr:phospholipase D-like domain-containing protein [Chloroflexota bacterium]
MNILHSTTDPNLLNRLREMLDSSARADIAVGYFFMSGFGAVSEELSRLDRVRILVGRADRPVLEAVAAGLQQPGALRARLDADSLVQRRERATVARESVDRIADGVSLMPQTKDSQQAVHLLREMVASGQAEIRAYRRSPLHAKAYLCWYHDHAEPGAAVVGSSNLTLAGFSGNTELNVRVTGDAEMATLREWFDALWEDAEDVSEALQLELDRSWALAKTPPYHVYLKALYELYHGGAGATELPLPPRDEELANFQLDAVRRGLAMIDIHGGCYIGDVVGLGKTFIGAELLRQLQFSYPHDGRPLILCPAGLKPMWESFNERFQLGASVISHSMIVPSGEAEFDEELGRYVDAAPPERGIVLSREYPDRGPVLVDEAHNFRNRNQRYAGLQEYLEAGDHKVVLLSATPQNLGPLDIYRQLRLFLDDTDHGLAIEPLDLREYFRNAQRWLDHRMAKANYEAEYVDWSRERSTPTPPLPPAEPTVPRADITQVLSPLFIRRRRRDIRDLYGDSAIVGGRPVQFPTPVLENVDYRLDRVYARAGTFKEITDALKAHKATRYRASDYLHEEFKPRPEYRGLLRTRTQLAGLMKMLLLKRFESSAAAFLSTLEALSRSNRHFREGLEAGYVPVGATASRVLAGERFDADELLEILQQEEQARGDDSRTAHPVAHFDTERLITDLDADHAVLAGLAARVRAIAPEDDDKLRALRAFLDRPDVRAGKVLIFSEAETTVDYLYEQLNPGGRDPAIARLSGSNRGEVEGLVTRFSPRSNPPAGRELPGPEIRLLLATDLVSEGQNLQDCARVLNYDLHWNPVHLIQRFGRVDRIGTEHAVIDLHNMWPDLEVDAGLELTGRLHRRIQAFHDLIGLDNKLLSESERLNAGAMYRIYDKRRLPESDDGLDEVAAHQRAVALLQRIREDDPALWGTISSLPDGIRSALLVQPVQQPREDADNDSYAQNVLPIDGVQAPLLSPANLAAAPPAAFDDPRPGETLVLLGAGEIHGCYAVGSGRAPRSISPVQFVAAAQCSPETPGEALPDDTNERVMAAAEAFKTEFGQRLGRTRRPRNTRSRRYVSRQLALASRATADDSEETRRIETLRRIFIGELPTAAENALDEIRHLRLEGRVLRIRLEALRERYRLNVPDASVAARPSEPELIRIVCSDGLAE